MTKRERDKLRSRRKRWQRRLSKGTRICPTDGFPIIHHTVEGRLVAYCQGCERRWKKVCMDCARPVRVAWRCPEHRKRRKAEMTRKSNQRRDPSVHCAYEKKRYRRDPLYNLKRRMYLREWRAKNPEKVQEQRRRAKCRAS